MDEAQLMRARKTPVAGLYNELYQVVDLRTDSELDDEVVSQLHILPAKDMYSIARRHRGDLTARVACLPILMTIMSLVEEEE